jgi:C1A family cysteine protease
MKYGWKRDLPNHKDLMYSSPQENYNFPKEVDLTRMCPLVYDQGSLGSCTANAIAAAVQFCRTKQNYNPDFTPSRLFIYYNEREIEEM